MFLNHRGKAAAFAAARQQLTPHAAAALQLAVQHLLLTQTAQHVLPPCTLVYMDGLAGGAHTSGARQVICSRFLRGSMRAARSDERAKLTSDCPLARAPHTLLSHTASAALQATCCWMRSRSAA